ncbi:hypothetical protein FRC09_020357 [Ceratobasidium sp. 395]|nr:hypothetical protein FRC09_020357 [Ceratobasidium sp. 395]
MACHRYNFHLERVRSGEGGDHLRVRAETQRIHPYLPSPSPPLPPLPSSSAPGTSPSRSSRGRQPLSITIPPRLGAPIRPVAELIAMQSPSPPYTHARRNTPRSRSASRTPGIVSPSQLSDLGVLERAHAAFSRPRGMSDSEPSPETRERVLRLLGRLPENAQGESDVHNGEERESIPGTERRVQGEERVREVRRTRSESMLSGAFLQPSSDA